MEIQTARVCSTHSAPFLKHVSEMRPTYLLFAYRHPQCGTFADTVLINVA